MEDVDFPEFLIALEVPEVHRAPAPNLVVEDDGQAVPLPQRFEGRHVLVLRAWAAMKNDDGRRAGDEVAVDFVVGEAGRVGALGGEGDGAVFVLVFFRHGDETVVGRVMEEGDRGNFESMCVLSCVTFSRHLVSFSALHFSNHKVLFLAGHRLRGRSAFVSLTLAGSGRCGAGGSEFTILRELPPTCHQTASL